MGCSDDEAARELAPEHHEEAAWGPSDVTMKLRAPARFVAIGSQSEVDSAVVVVDGIGPVVVSVGAPIVDLPIRKGSLVKPHTPNPTPAQEWLDARAVARLELITLPYVPRAAWPTSRAPREYYEEVELPAGELSDPEDEESSRLAGEETLVGQYPVRGAHALSVFLRASGAHPGSSVEYRVVAYRIPGLFIAAIDPPTLGDWLTLTGAESYNLPVHANEVDFVRVFARQGEGSPGSTRLVLSSAIVRDVP